LSPTEVSVPISGVVVLPLLFPPVAEDPLPPPPQPMSNEAANRAVHSRPWRQTPTPFSGNVIIRSPVLRRVASGACPYLDSPVVPSAACGQPPVHVNVEICIAGLPVVASYAWNTIRSPSGRCRIDSPPGPTQRLLPASNCVPPPSSMGLPVASM